MKKMLLVGLLTLSVSAFGGESVTGDALKALHSDKTFDMTHYKNGHGLVYFGSDGSMLVKRDTGETIDFTWWISKSGDRRCFQRVSDKKRFCRLIEKEENGEYLLKHPKSGKVLVTVHKVLDGNQLPQ